MKYKFDEYAISRDLVTRRSVDSRMTTRQAAKEIGISPSTLSRIERRISLPDMNTLLLLCSWLDKAPTVYFFEVKQAPNAQ